MTKLQMQLISSSPFGKTPSLAEVYRKPVTVAEIAGTLHALFTGHHHNWQMLHPIVASLVFQLEDAKQEIARLKGEQVDHQQHSGGHDVDQGTPELGVVPFLLRKAIKNRQFKYQNSFSHRGLNVHEYIVPKDSTILAAVGPAEYYLCWIKQLGTFVGDTPVLYAEFSQLPGDATSNDPLFQAPGPSAARERVRQAFEAHYASELE
jgi:hypothetical protein